VHLGLIDGATTFAMIAVRAGSHQVGPNMFPTQVARSDMIHGKIWNMLTAVLTGVVVPAQDLSFGQLHLRAGAVDHFFQADNGRTRIDLPDSFDLAASIQDQAGFSIDDQGDCTASVADIDRLKVGV